MNLTALQQLKETSKNLVEEFQCPGCVCGGDIKCGKFKLNDSYGVFCEGHVLGTSIGIGNYFALGLPKGFCKPGFNQNHECRNTMNIRLWERGTAPNWNKLNVPVWAMEKDGFLFVRTFSPRLNTAYVDVIEGGTLADTPNAINVEVFIGEID